MFIHTVAPGETVYQIARQYNTSPTKILEDNDITHPERLAVGQTLVILFPTKTYTVKRGDTFEGIAAAFGISLRTLFQNNPVLGGESTVYPGQVLTISYPQQPYPALSVNGYAMPSIPRDVLRRTLPYLTYLTVFAARFTEDGNVILPNDELLLTEARKYGVAPILLLANLNEGGAFSSSLVESLLANPAARSRLSENLEKVIKEKNYAGVEFDLEYVPAAYSQTYANLVDSTRQRLAPEGRCVFVALSPKRDRHQSGLLYEGHDYESLGEAANGVRLMTYEWGSTYGPPMPVAPLPQVAGVLDYAKKAVPEEKISMGIPSYGYDWKLPYEAGGTRAESLSSTGAVERAAKENAAIEYDQNRRSPYYTYYDTSTSPAVQHIVYFEDGNSIKAKLDLVNELGLSGVSLWNIMSYLPQYYLILHQLFGTVEPYPCKM